MSAGFILYIADTETTNLSNEGDIIELSIVRVIFKDNNKHEIEQKTWLLKAVNISAIQEEALKINGHKYEDITHRTEYGKQNYLEPSEVIISVEEWINQDNFSALDRILAGQNIQFDIEKLQILWERLGATDTFPFALERGNRTIDTKQIVALFDICTGKRRQYWSLSNLVKACGTKKDKAHNAAGDTLMTANLLLFLISIIKDSVKEKFIGCYNEEK